VRAEIIAEFFSKEQNSGLLFPAARELEARAHMRSRADLTALSVEAKAIIGVFADFVGAKRTALLSSDFVTAPAAPPPAKRSNAEPTKAFKEVALEKANPEQKVGEASGDPDTGSGETSTAPTKIGMEPNPKLL